MVATQGDGQQQESHELGGECLGRGDTDLDPRPRVKHEPGLPLQGAVGGIDDRQGRLEFIRADVAQGRQRVRSFTGL